MNDSKLAAAIKGVVGGLVFAICFILARYLVSGGNDGGFVSAYLLTPLGLGVLIGAPVLFALYNVFVGPKKGKK